MIEIEFKPKVLLRSADTRSELSVIEGAMPPHRPGPPLHHHEFDETFYVIEGELTFQVREELITAEIDSTEPPPGSGPRSGT